jgi:Protein of unknown function (DUF2971)
MGGAETPTLDIGKLSGFLSSIGSFSENLILWFSVEQNLYHYTNLDGLRGIVENDDLWLTHTQYCNDDEELTHGLRLAKEVCQQVVDNPVIDAKPQVPVPEPKRGEYLKELTRLLNDPQADAVYICCFCEKDDLLSQWRAYGANGAGVSLEFETVEFSFITGPDCPPDIGLMRFWKVFYPLETQQKIIRNAINYYPAQQPSASASEWARWTAEAIRFFIPTFKNNDFSEEKEWRLILTPAVGSAAKPSYRVARNMLIPYYSLSELSKKLGQPDRKLPLRAVRIGPGPNKRLNVASVRMLLDKNGYEQVRVEASATPYRGAT